jgi:NADPH:quinone reductase-like Zn-dependent oxidoreductase
LTTTTPSKDIAMTSTRQETATMRAVVQDTYGTSEVLGVADRPAPTVEADQVLVRVHAAGLDRGTWHLMTGTPYAVRLAMGIKRPRQAVPGRDLAGVVEAVGADVTRFAPGDEVFGMGTGTFAELAVAPERKLSPKPANLTFEQAAVVPISGGTALQALDAGRCAAGQRVLVTGASGGVGSYVVQLAVAMGAEVTGVASAAKLDLVRSLGATHVLDYAVDDFADGSQHYDLVVDIAGNASLRRLRRALTPSGTAAIVGAEDAGKILGMSRALRAVLVSPFIGQRLVPVVSKERASDLDRLTPYLENGSVVPSVDRTYPLEQAPEAMARLEAGEVRGKIAISVRP